MKTLVLWISVMATIGFGIKYGLTKHEDGASVRNARTRVERVFGGMKSGTGTGNDVQTAICMWAENTVLVADRDALERYSDQFDRWRRQKDLYHSSQTFEITSVEKVDPNQQYPVVVTVTVDGGKPLEILVEAGGVLKWNKKDRA